MKSFPRSYRPISIQTDKPLSVWKQDTIAEVSSIPEITAEIAAEWKVQIVPQKTYERLKRTPKPNRAFEILRHYAVRHDGRLHRYTALLCEPEFDPSTGHKGGSNSKSGRRVQLQPSQRAYLNKPYKLNRTFIEAVQQQLPGFEPTNENCTALIEKGIAAIAAEPQTWAEIELPTIKSDWGNSENKTFAMRFSREQWQQVQQWQQPKETNSALLKRLLYAGAKISSNLL